jgi:hypothetical protein
MNFETSSIISTERHILKITQSQTRVVGFLLIIVAICIVGALSILRSGKLDEKTEKSDIQNRIETAHKAVEMDSLDVSDSVASKLHAVGYDTKFSTVNPTVGQPKTRKGE